MSAGQIVDSRATIVAFDLLAALSTFFGVLVVSTVFFSPKVYRRPTWYAAVVPCCVYTAIFLLLIGQQLETPSPGVCGFQAFLLYALPP